MLSDLDRLIQIISKLPGLGPRSGRRISLHLIKNRENIMKPLADIILKAYDTVKTCEICGNIDSASPCSICTDNKRDANTLCVVEDMADLWAIERSKIFKGKYHVLGGTLSAIDGVGPDALGIGKLVSRVGEGTITEVIMATNATVEGQTTAHYITERLKDFNIKVSRLAYGIPIGGELDYLDEGTLSAALKSRQYY